ncbi:sigma factor, partial [Acinetobacter baumannii]
HDERALMALYEATLSRVYGLVLRLVRRPQLAEEVAEEVYVQVWRQAPRFDAARGRPLTWLLGMARSRAIDAIRREARYQHESLDE